MLTKLYVILIFSRHNDNHLSFIIYFNGLSKIESDTPVLQLKMQIYRYLYSVQIFKNEYVKFHYNYIIYPHLFYYFVYR